MTAKTHRIVIEPTSIRGERGQRYRVLFEGAVLIEDTWNPEFEACRALVAQGVTGRLEVWRADKPYPGLIFPDIEEGARWTVEENDKVGPRIIPWEPFPDRPQPNAVSSSGEIAAAAENCPDGVNRSTDETGRPAKHRARPTGIRVELCNSDARPACGPERRPTRSTNGSACLRLPSMARQCRRPCTALAPWAHWVVGSALPPESERSRTRKAGER